MKVHLLERHRDELITHLPIRGRGFDMNYRAGFVIDFIKRRKPQEFYDHRTAKFVCAGFVPQQRSENRTMLVAQNFVDLRNVHPFVKWQQSGNSFECNNQARVREVWRS
jgi:hypothetical protein